MAARPVLTWHGDELADGNGRLRQAVWIEASVDDALLLDGLLALCHDDAARCHLEREKRDLYAIYIVIVRRRLRTWMDARSVGKARGQLHEAHREVGQRLAYGVHCSGCLLWLSGTLRACEGFRKKISDRLHSR